MKNQTYLDCILLMGSAVSLNLPEMSRPILQEVLTTMVTLSITVEQIVIEDHKLEFNVVLLLTENWLDLRLEPNAKTRSMAVSGKIWDPKITNILGEQYNENLENTVFWRGYGDGNIILCKKIKIKNYCSGDLKDFPFDTQIFEVKFGSYRFSDDEVLIKWNDISPVIIPNEIHSKEFYLENVSTKIIEDVRPTGNFSSGLVIFKIKRNPKHYLICIGIPCTVMVILNYLSIWIKSRRSQINVSSMAVHFYYYHLSTCQIHPVPYFKNLDVLVGLSTLISIMMLVQSVILVEIENDTFFGNQSIVKKYLNGSWISLLSKISYPLLYLMIILINYRYYL